MSWSFGKTAGRSVPAPKIEYKEYVQISCKKYKRSYQYFQYYQFELLKMCKHVKGFLVEDN